MYVGNGFFAVHFEFIFVVMVLVMLTCKKIKDLFSFSYSMVYWTAGSCLFKIS